MREIKNYTKKNLRDEPVLTILLGTRMAITRSKLNSVERGTKTPKKIKFLDNDADINDNEYHTAEEAEGSNEPTDLHEESESDSNSDSDSDSDEAPEEESTSGVRDEILAKQKLEQKLEQDLKRREKEKRRQQNIHNQQQKLAKKSKVHEEKDLPEFLPDNIFESIDDEETNEEPVITSKHLKLQDFEKLDEISIRKQMKEAKLKEIKKNKKLSIKKGPVHVKVQQFNLDKKVVPKFENKVVNTRNKWLKRKSLGKK